MNAAEVVGDFAAGQRGAAASLARALESDRRATFDALTSAAAEHHRCLDEVLRLVRADRIVVPPIRRYLIAEDDVDMAEQQTLVAIAVGIGSYSGTGSAEAWMRQIAANESKMLIRSRARHNDRAAGTVSDHEGDFVQRLSTMVADAATIRRMLDTMREEWRRALELREQGLAYEEVAAAMDVPVGTAKTWVRRARRQLADLVIEHGSALGAPRPSGDSD